jgi:dienelactone hydrolase/WD40 repeat protein
MKQLRSLTFLFLPLLGACSLSGTSPSASTRSDAHASPRMVARHDAATFYGTTSFRGASFAPDGKSLLFTSDANGVFNAYTLALSGAGIAAGAEPVQVTQSTSDAITTIGFFPMDDRFLFMKDHGGNELDHLFVHVPSGEPVDLTPGESLKSTFVRWGSDRSSFFALTNERDPKAFDLYRYRFGAPDAKPVEAAARSEIAPGYSREMLFQNSDGYQIGDVSPGGELVALQKNHDNADSDVFLTRTKGAAAGPELVRVTPHEGKVSNKVGEFSPDGKRLYYMSNEEGEFDRVWAYDVASGERSPAYAADWDVTTYHFSDDGRRLVVGVNADARTRLSVFDGPGGREIPLPKLPDGDITGVSFERDGDRMAFYVNGDASPANLHVVDLPSGRHEQLTQALNPEIAPSDLVDSQNVRYPSFDKLAIPALLYRPHQASPDQRVPALVYVHGGPGGQCRTGYNPIIQHLVNHGYAVLAINNRGSSGYGKTFYHLDDRAHGDVDLKDCVYGRRYLESLDWIDGKRVGIIGGSYGGYLVCAALAFEPDAFDVGIDIFGVTNWLRTLASIPPWWSEFRDSLYAEVGDPTADKQRLESRSPLLHAANIRKPILVIQGKNDPRVLEAESREIAAAVEKKGVPVEFIEFPDEGHGFRIKANRIRASDAFVAFLDRYLAVPAAKP